MQYVLRNIREHLIFPPTWQPEFNLITIREMSEVLRASAAIATCNNQFLLDTKDIGHTLFRRPQEDELSSDTWRH